MYKACQSLTVSNPIRQEETNSMDMTKISISIINEGIMYTIYKVTTLRAQETTYFSFEIIINKNVHKKVYKNMQ